MDIIAFDDFVKLEIKIGKIISAEKVEGSDKLLKLEVDFGLVSPTLSGRSETSSGRRPKPEAKADPESQGEPASASSEAPARQVRQIIAGIAQYYAPEALVGKECPFAYNLSPRTLKGLESQGMILCPSGENGPVLLHPDKEVPPGSLVK